MVTILAALALFLGSDFDSGKARFTIKVQGDAVAYERFSVFTLPGQEVRFESDDPADRDFVFDVPEGEIARPKPTLWIWRAPAKTGVYKVKISSPQHEDQMTINVIVMVPAQGVVLNGYRIGAYPAKPLNNNPIYLAPAGFIEVTKENQDLKLTPHFKLEQFLCKQAGGYPKYVALNQQLLLKLERILEQLNRHGFPAGTLHVMSGYRTPFYNKALGNVEYSLHQYGRAADIYIDTDDSGMIDDLNHDGVITPADAGVMRAIVNELPEYPGGVGIYKATPAHGPYIHVDVRGKTAAWGNVR